METNGSIGVSEASAALASVERSRERVAWAGYPGWYWFTTAAFLAALPLATLLPVWSGLAGTAVVSVLWIVVIHAANRVRGVCEGWTRTAMRWQEVTVLYGPAIAVTFTGAITSPFAWWLPVVAAVLGYVLFAGTGLALSARVERR